jgi:hypothetical protein
VGLGLRKPQMWVRILVMHILVHAFEFGNFYQRAVIGKAI